MPILVAATGLAILVLQGCKPAADGLPAGGTGTAVAAPDVSTVTAAAATVPRTLDLPGRLTSTRVAEVRAQVSGIIQDRTFEEGSLVAKGDVLFRIDPAIYRAEVDAKAAALARAEATRVQAQRQSERTETLLERQAASAAQQVDPIFADFNAPADDPGRLASGKAETEVHLVLPDGSLHADAGRLLFTDVSVDPGTRRVSLRATFPKPRVALLPGTYVRVRVAQGSLPGAVVVPAQAIQRSGAGVAPVFVIGDDRNVALRPVRAGALAEVGWIVEDGLRAGETVVVEGFQRLQPGMAVNPSPWQAPWTASASASASAKP